MQHWKEPSKEKSIRKLAAAPVENPDVLTNGSVQHDHFVASRERRTGTTGSTRSPSVPAAPNCSHTPQMKFFYCGASTVGRKATPRKTKTVSKTTAVLMFRFLFSRRYLLRACTYTPKLRRKLAAAVCLPTLQFRQQSHRPTPLRSTHTSHTTGGSRGGVEGRAGGWALVRRSVRQQWPAWCFSPRRAYASSIRYRSDTNGLSP